MIKTVLYGWTNIKNAFQMYNCDINTILMHFDSVFTDMLKNVEFLYLIKLKNIEAKLVYYVECRMVVKWRILNKSAAWTLSREGNSEGKIQESKSLKMQKIWNSKIQ